jgi:hypothetical protein
VLTQADLAQIQAMIDAGAGIGEGFAEPIVAGQQLIIPGIQSPNFSLAGQTGWQLLVSGLATFFNVVLSGGTVTGPDYILNPQGFFFYSAAPAHGNLIISVAPAAGTDGFANAYPAGIEIFGATAFQSNSGNNTAILSAGSLQFLFILATLLTLSNSGVFLYTGSGGLGNLIASMASSAGADPSGNAYPQGLFSQQLTLANQGSAPPAFAGASVFYSSTAGRPRYKSSAGADNVVERSDVNVAAFPIGNVATTQNISAPLNYLANEGSQGSEYEIEIDGTINTGSVTAQTLTFELAIDASVLGGAFTIGAVYLANNLSFEYSIRFRLTITTTGAGGTANMVSDGGVNRSAVNLGSVANTTLSVGAVGTGKAFDTTAAHTIQAQAFWGGTNTGQSLTTVRTRVTRRFLWQGNWQSARTAGSTGPPASPGTSPGRAATASSGPAPCPGC